jgi:type IV pilus assembly protein PilA
VLARLRKSGEQNESGFTLIELLVVMIIIGILAAIAIPIFLSQRKKAQDAAAKADISTLGKEIVTYYVDGTGTDANAGKPVVAVNAVTNHYVLTVLAVNGEAAVSQDLGKASANNTLAAPGAQFYAGATSWCVSLTNPLGNKSVAGMSYSAANGLAIGKVCTSAAG